MYEELIDRDKYVFFENGKIFSNTNNKIIDGCVNKQGYVQTTLLCIDGKRRVFKIHRVIAFLFIPKPDHLSDIPYNELQVDHINRNKQDNRVENLRWCTSKENHNNPLSIEAHRISNSRTFSEEAKLKMSLAKKDNFVPWNKGGHHTEKTKKLLSEMFKGKHRSPSTEFKKGIIPWNKQV